MKNPKPLNAGSIVDIIAPSGKILDPENLKVVQKFLKKNNYQGFLGKNILGDHDFLSNTIELRFQDLKDALFSRQSTAIWQYRGGSGSAELLPLLSKLDPPPTPKIFLGFSDLTSLHIFLNQEWDWLTFHGPGAKQIATNSIDKMSQNSVLELFQVGFKQNQLLDLKLSAFNAISKKTKKFPTLTGKIIGGNLTVISHSLGTPYQINAKNKILFLEDLNEPAYKVRRMLTQLAQGEIFKNIKALILGEFSISHSDPATQLKLSKELNKELSSFSHDQKFPVYKTSLSGHGKKNKVIPFNLPVCVV